MKQMVTLIGPIFIVNANDGARCCVKCRRSKERVLLVSALCWGNPPRALNPMAAAQRTDTYQLEAQGTLATVE